MTGCIQEHDFAAKSRRFLILDSHFVSADMLRDSARFAFRNAGRTNRVEQRSLAVIHVAHDRDDRWPRYCFGSTVFARGCRVSNFLLRLLFKADDIRVSSKEASHLTGQFRIKRLVDGREHTSRQQPSDQVLGANIQLLRQILHADAFRNRDAPRDGLWLVRER